MRPLFVQLLTISLATLPVSAAADAIETHARETGTRETGTTREFTPQPTAFRETIRDDDAPLVIAHRGASGYIPEHTLAAYAAAYFMGADVIEPDVVLTKDGVLICSHDLTLDTTTDIAQKFPGRARGDGKHHAIDFTVAELKTLQKLGRKGRVRQSGHTIATLDEMIGLIQSLNASTGRTVGIIPEPKSPSFHRAEGQPIERPLVTTLARHGYTERADACVIQCFDLGSLEFIRSELGCDLTLAFVFGSLPDTATLTRAAKSCDALGPRFTLLTKPDAETEALRHTVRTHGMAVYPWTFGKDDTPTARALRMGVDGVFTDYPDRAISIRDATRKHAKPLWRN